MTKIHPAAPIRDQQLSIRWSPSEWARMESAAAAGAMTFTELVRNSALAGAATLLQATETTMSKQPRGGL